MKITPKISNIVVENNSDNKNRWSLAIACWVGNEIREIFATGQTRGATLKNWFFQYYEGNVPEGARLPSGGNLIFLSWVEFK